MNRLRLVTLNIWNRMGPWDERRVLIRDGLAALAPDVVGMQEVLRLVTDEYDENQAQQIVGELGWNVAYGRGHELTPGLAFGNAVASPHPIVTHETIPLPGGDDSDQQRSVLHAVVSTPIGEVHAFVTHLNWKLHEGRVRVAQVRFLAARIAERVPVASGAFPPVLMGDMNAEPDSDEMRFLRGLAVLEGESVYFADCWALAGDGGPGYTFSPDNTYAREVHEPPRRLDYVYVRGPDKHRRGQPLAARVVFDEPADGVFASDHYGVVAEVSVGAASFEDVGSPSP
jgi:endonuclease/exonuclease/phosphatase family metal-dependent hydrolase